MTERILSDADFAKRLIEGCRDVGVDVDSSAIPNMYTQFQLLIHWNRKINLTGLTDPETIVVKHFVDSLLPLNQIPKRARVLDIGSGPGFPGLPLAVARPDLRVVLSEAVAKKRVFLAQVLRAIGSTSIAVVGRSTELEAEPALTGVFDLVTTRALGDLTRIAKTAKPFLADGGAVFAWKGKKAAAEIDEHSPALERLGYTSGIEIEAALPVTGDARAIVVLRRKAAPA